MVGLVLSSGWLGFYLVVGTDLKLCTPGGVYGGVRKCLEEPRIPSFSLQSE